MGKGNRNFEIDSEVKSFILEHKRDFRLCTTCGGPVIVPVEMKAPKDSDIVVQIGPNKLYISKVQAHYLHRIEKQMLAYYKRYLEKTSQNI
ncbi:MAG: hypothetical protein H5T43_00505 [Methanomethylovorans sp.]|jgi:hypothetical protein|nr:hypothetical protein [Methanomethylovorans sp.]